MIRVGLLGTNGHQIHKTLVAHPRARLVALADFSEDKLVPVQHDYPELCVHASFESLIADTEVDLVSLCSSRRVDQADQAVRALRAGKHVLAEKPCALNETDLDAIIVAARASGRVFHEMAGTAFGQPYLAMRGIVRSGRLGQIVQIVSEKSYPYYAGRAQDEAIDGGLILQNAIHALRFVEHIAGVPIASVCAMETSLGNPVAGGGLRMATSLSLTLKNGGVASLAANYLNPPGTGVWGDESLKILGTLGLVESRAGGQFTRLVIGREDLGPLDVSAPGLSWLDAFLSEITDATPFPLSLDDELSPTRWAIRADRDAKTRHRL